MNRARVIFYLFGLSNILFQSPTAHADASLDAKIIAIDEQIRKEEQKQSHDAKKLADLVTEYNKLVQEQASSEQKNEPLTPAEQTHEEAVIQRLKEHEQRIDQLEKMIATLMKAVGITPTETPVELNSVVTTTVATNPTIATTTAISDNKHTEANRATEQATLGTSPTLDTVSPALAKFNQAMALLNLGFKTGSTEDLKNAAEAFEVITTSYPNETYADKAYVHSGDIYLKLGNIDEAQKNYKIAITKPLDRQNAIRARLGYGETLLSQNNKQDACAQIKILSNERLASDLLQRFDALKNAASCQIAVTKPNL